MKAFALFLMIALPATGFAAEKSETDGLQVVNLTSEPLYFDALELEDSYLVDPQPDFPSPKEIPLRRVEPNAGTPLGPVPEYSVGKSIRLLVYVPETKDGKPTGKILFDRTVDFLADQIRQDPKLRVKPE